MKVSYYCQEYTHGRVYFKDILKEIVEFLQELIKFNRKGMKEEFSDTISFVQCWLWNRFKIDGKLWKLALPSYQKFIKRRKVWQQIYNFVGIKHRCTYCKNYQREYKVVRHLATFAISKEKALQAYQKIVLKQ